MDSIDKALESLKLQDNPNIAATAREYEVDRTNVHPRVASHPPCLAKLSVLLSSEQSRLRTHICIVCILEEVEVDHFCICIHVLVTVTRCYGWFVMS